MKVRKGKKSNSKSLKILVFSLLLLLVLLLLLLLFRKTLINNRNYYQLDSRLEQVEKAKKTDADDYRTVGWIKVQGTNIDMPILQGIGPSFKAPVEKKKYSWMEENDGKFHNKMNVFGHNIFNLSAHPKIGQDSYERFEDLMSFVYYDFAKENKYIQLTMDGQEYIYKIFAAGFMYDYDVQLFSKDGTYADDVEWQLKLAETTNLYDYDVDVSEEDSLISLVTCTRFFGTDSYRDFVVMGRLLRDDEKTNDYSVEKSKNYDKVDEMLKGDDSNEEDEV